MNETMTARRQLALYHLRNNPKNRKQGTGDLYNPFNDSYCALGLLGEGFGYPVREDDPKIITKVYEELCESLGIYPGLVYRPNDRGETFWRIADILEDYFKANPRGRHDLPEYGRYNDPSTSAEDN